MQHPWYGGRSKSSFKTLFQTHISPSEINIITLKPCKTKYKEYKHKIENYRIFQYQAFRKIQPKKMNSNNLQVVSYAMGINHTKVKAKVTSYLFSYAHKTTIGMKIYTRSYDLSIKTTHRSLIPICLNLINPLIALEHG